MENLYYKKTIVVEMSQNPEEKIKLSNMLDELKSELQKERSKLIACFAQW
jgi:hypothetical protein